MSTGIPMKPSGFNREKPHCFGSIKHREPAREMHHRHAPFLLKSDAWTDIRKLTAEIGYKQQQRGEVYAKPATDFFCVLVEEYTV